MRIPFVLLLSLIFNGLFSQPYPSLNISLLGRWYDSTVVAEPQHGIKYNGTFGWFDPSDNREYAIIGSSAGTYFIDITDPYLPIMRDYVAGRRDSCVWREIHVYRNYCYIVSDDPMPNSFQIVDISSLPDSVHVVHDSTNIITRCHTIFIDGNKLYGGIPKGPFGQSSLAVFSLNDPENPVLLRRLEQDYSGMDGTHDMFVRNDTVFASMSSAGYFVFFYDSILNKFTLLGSLTSYPFKGYNHSSSVSSNGEIAIMCDEVPAGLEVKVLNVKDISDIKVSATYQSNSGATPHNPYIIGNNHVVISYYQDGVQIYDISDPSNPVRSGYFDTRPEIGDNNGYPGDPYQGCWGAFTRFPSGNITASDMQNGLFILDATAALENNGIAGDKNGNGIIDSTEIAGDANENGMIDSIEISGDISGNGAIGGNELSGDINGNFLIDSGELAGDVNGNGIIDNDEVLGDVNGNGTIDGSELAGDRNGDGTLNELDWILAFDETRMLSENLLVFPVPASDRVFVYFNGRSKFLNYELLDLTGRTIVSGTLESRESVKSNNFREVDISLRNISGGIYLLRVEGEGFSGSRKIIKSE